MTLPKRFPRPNSKAAFSVSLDKPTQKRWKLFGELKARSEAVTRMTPFLAAQETFRGVQARIPGGPTWSAYRRQLQFVRVGSKSAENPIFAVYEHARASVDRELDVDRTVLYVKPKKNSFGPVKPEVRILHKFGPWTLDTLPLTPKRNEAVVVVRKVSKREIQRIKLDREKDSAECRKALEEAGVRNVRAAPAKPELNTKVLRDTAFEALRLEFGFGGVKPVPHWRPAINDALQYVQKLYRKKSIFSDAMTKVGYSAWRKWPLRAESSIKIGSLGEFSKFQKRLHIRVR